MKKDDFSDFGKTLKMEQERDKDFDKNAKGVNKMELGGTMTDKEKKYREEKFEELARRRQQ